MAKPNSIQNAAAGEFIQTNDPLALAALIEAGLKQPGRTIIDLGTLPPSEGSVSLTPRQALVVGARACDYLLTGQPELATFDPADLELAAAWLRCLADLMVRGGRA